MAMAGIVIGAGGWIRFWIVTIKVFRPERFWNGMVRVLLRSKSLTRKEFGGNDGCIIVFGLSIGVG